MKITYSDNMGDDLKVVNMARVSFDKRSEWVNQYEYEEWLDTRRSETEFVGVLSAPDKSLIQFLARGCTTGDWEKLVDDVAFDGYYAHEGGYLPGERPDLEQLLNHVRKMPSHWAPFAHCQITLHMKVPMFVQRQLDKHQVGFTTSEMSRRYVTSEPEFYVPDTWRKAADNVKQGSSDEEVEEIEESYPFLDGVASTTYHPKELAELVNNGAVEAYNLLIKQGQVCAEQARMVLPQSMYTESIKTGSLYGWANLYNQRSDPHAQKETQQVAEMVREIIEPLYPVSWEALTA